MLWLLRKACIKGRWRWQFFVYVHMVHMVSSVYDISMEGVQWDFWFLVGSEDLSTSWIMKTAFIFTSQSRKHFSGAFSALLNRLSSDVTIGHHIADHMMDRLITCHTWKGVYRLSTSHPFSLLRGTCEALFGSLPSYFCTELMIPASSSQPS